MTIVTKTAALNALDSMDDYARMDVGVDAIGPRRTLSAFIEQQPPWWFDFAVGAVLASGFWIAVHCAAGGPQ